SHPRTASTRTLRTSGRRRRSESLPAPRWRSETIAVRITLDPDAARPRTPPDRADRAKTLHIATESHSRGAVAGEAGPRRRGRGAPAGAARGRSRHDAVAPPGRKVTRPGGENHCLRAGYAGEHLRMAWTGEEA